MLRQVSNPEYESGDTHLLYEDTNTKTGSTEVEITGTASSSTEPPPKRPRTIPRRGTDTLSLSQAVEAYCASALDADEDPAAMTGEEADGVPQDPASGDTDNTTLSLLFSGLYQGHVTLGKNGY